MRDIVKAVSSVQCTAFVLQYSH